MSHTFVHYNLIQETDLDTLSPWVKKEDIDNRNFQSETRQTVFLLTRALLRKTLLHVTNSQDWIVKTETNGKPFIETSKGRKGPHISLSHTSNMIACTICDEAPIGIDIEYNKPRNIQAIAQSSFGREEQKKVQAGGLSEFYRIWTLREAFAKMDGRGLSLVTNRKDLNEHSACSFYEEIPVHNYHLAIAVYNPLGMPVKWIKSK